MAGGLGGHQKKIVTDCAASFYRTNQQFTYYDRDRVEYKITNKFNYVNLALGLGYWYKKGNKWSAMYVSGIMFGKYISAVGYTYDKTNNVESARLNRVIAYTHYPVSFSGNLTFLLDYNNSIIEFGPYVVFSPFSLTDKSEAYSTTRFFYGLSIGLTTKLFN